MISIIKIFLSLLTLLAGGLKKMLNFVEELKHICIGR